MDVINLISKVQTFPDAPISNADEEFQPAPMYYANGYALTYPLDFYLLRADVERLGHGYMSF